MKIKLRTIIICIITLLSLFGCAPDIEGTYKDQSGMLEYTFKDGKATQEIMGTKQQYSYKLDGDKVIMNVMGNDLVLVASKDRKTLSGPIGTLKKVN